MILISPDNFVRGVKYLNNFILINVIKNLIFNIEEKIF